MRYKFGGGKDEGITIPKVQGSVWVPQVSNPDVSLLLLTQLTPTTSTENVGPKYHQLWRVPLAATCWTDLSLPLSLSAARALPCVLRAAHLICNVAVSCRKAHASSRLLNNQGLQLNLNLACTKADLGIRQEGPLRLLSDPLSYQDMLIPAYQIPWAATCVSFADGTMLSPEVCAAVQAGDCAHRRPGSHLGPQASGCSKHPVRWRSPEARPLLP